MPAEEPATQSARPPANFAKQAVVVIHGIGEQIPMDTLKGFVRAAWETDTQITDNGMPQPAEVWSKPDQRTGSFELRRITTRQSMATPTFPDISGDAGSGGVRTDFYELYWADLSASSTLEQLGTWIAGLLMRNPFTRVPRSVRSAWVFLWIVSLAIVYLLLAPVLTPTGRLWRFYPYGWMQDWQPWILPIIGALLAWVANCYLLAYAGRVVRYTRATPENIAARKDIRERGLALLDSLHEAEYERIIVVGHSLGSILGYDLISYFWARRLASHTVIEGSRAFEALRCVEETLAAYGESHADSDLEQFRKAQRKFCRELRRRPKSVAPAGMQPTAKATDEQTDPRWLITDFVTLGSPLTHADFLLASDTASLQARVDTRDYPIAPPVREVLDKKFFQPAKNAGLPLSPARQPELLSFKFPPANWQTHHAAPFAAVRWTNIYDPARFIFCGDLISGPLAGPFGRAIVDVNLAQIRGQSWTFTHTKYWELDDANAPPPAHIVELRRALNLAGQVEDV
jgi:hypothetical protein